MSGRKIVFLTIFLSFLVALKIWKKNVFFPFQGSNVKNYTAMYSRNNELLFPGCFFRYTHRNEGMGGTFNQLLVGKVMAVLRGLEFCMMSEKDLLDWYEPEGHTTDNGWLRKYWNLPRCPSLVNSCDYNYTFNPAEDWKMHYVWRLYELHYKNELDLLTSSLEASPLNKNLEYCAHVRTGDALSLPVVPWSEVELHVFGALELWRYPFCETNKCISMPKTKSVHFDFVNLVNCKNLAACDSSLSITAKLLNRHNTEYVKVRGVQNKRFTEYFNGLVAPSNLT